MDFGNREKEKAVILLAGEVVLQYGITFWAVCNLKLHNFLILQKGICDIVLFLQIVQD
jgi:hypothetical protein